MDRFEHCMLEFYWSQPSYTDSPTWKPSFTIFHADGRHESRVGGNAEITAALNALGKEGWRITSAVTTMNWILWTLERKVG